MMKKLLFLIFIVVMAAGCEDREAKYEINQFFSLKDFFENEIERLKVGDIRLEKTAFIGEKKETVILDSVYWPGELRLFIDSDINKPAFITEYDTSSESTPDGKEIKIYKAKRDDLDTQLLRVIFSEGKVELIEIVLNDENMVYDSERKLIYIPDNGYRIEAQQEVMFSDPERFKIEAKFIK